MTEPTPTPLTGTPVIPRVAPVEGSRLEQLHAAYAEAKATADDATAALKAVVDALKVEISNLAPEGSEKVQLTGNAGPPLQLAWQTSWRFDSKRLKVDNPELYVRYAKQSGTWVLKTFKPGDEE